MLIVSKMYNNCYSHNRNYNKILEFDWSSAALIRALMVIGLNVVQLRSNRALNFKSDSFARLADFEITPPVTL